MAQMSWNEACQLDPTLLSLSSDISEPIRAETLSGLSNVNWKLSFATEPPLVWRPASAMSEAFSVSRIQEYQILKLLEHQSTLLLTPKARLVNHYGLLVEWLEGDEIDAISDETLLRLAVEIHQIDLSKTPILPFSYTARVDHYWLKLHDSPHITPQITQLYKQLRNLPFADLVPATLCHFDLGCHNLIRCGAGYQVIDWEYASLADPRIELAMLVETQQTELATFVARYCTLRNIAEIDDWIAAVKAWIPRVRLMAMLWYYLAHQYWQTEQHLNNANQLLAQLCSGDHCLLNPEKQ